MHPEQLGPYRIGERLGRGGMGSVYEAVDTGSGTVVAVKLLATHLADDPGLRARFRAEIETLKELRHPAIVQLLAFGEEDGQPYFAMELVRGRTLEQLLRSGRRFTWKETVAVATSVARALKVAHDHGVIHRDLKPSNLLVAEGSTPGDGVKLADFGIAKLFGSAAQTAHGNIVGTAEYMAPEQAAGEAVDHRADLYALGLVMFAMLAGRPPFRGVQATEVIRKQRTTPAPRVSTAVEGVPPELDTLIDRLLAKNPDARPGSALALVRLLTAIDTHVTTAEAPRPVRPDKLVIDDLPRTPPESGAAAPLSGDNTTVVGPFAGEPGTAGRGTADSAPGPGGAVPAGPVPATPAAPTVATPAPALRPAAARATKPPEDEATQASSSGAATATHADGGVRGRHTTLAELDAAQARQRQRREAREALWRWPLALGITAGVLAGGWSLLRPRTADELHARILAVATAPGGDLRDAEDDITRFLARHADDPRAPEVAAIARRLEVDRLERRSRHKLRSGRLLEPIERDYRAAMEREADGPSACIEALEALVALHPGDDGETGLWVELARRQIGRLAPLAQEERRQDLEKIAGILAAAAALAAEAEDAAPPRREEALAERRRLLEGVIDTYQRRPHAEEAVRDARQLIGDDAPAPAAPQPPEDRP
ncbi:MAG: serine/threonine-protein kinase [Planctomycetaceae bacterium]